MRGRSSSAAATTRAATDPKIVVSGIGGDVRKTDRSIKVPRSLPPTTTTTSRANWSVLFLDVVRKLNRARARALRGRSRRSVDDGSLEFIDTRCVRLSMVHVVVS